MSPQGQRKMEKQWLKDNWDTALNMYPNQYIALYKDQMMCHGQDEEHIKTQIDTINDNMNLNIQPLIIFVAPNSKPPEIS